MKNEIERYLPKWQQGLSKTHRHKIIYGGRGSGKSYAVADALITESLYKKHLVLCGREFQNSIKESVHSLLQQRIEALGFTEYFEITRDEINCAYSSSRFIFKGLRHNIDSIKSMAGITRLWIEEADTLSAESWRIIEPTIREPESEIWCTLNPKNKTDILYKTFIANEPPKNTYAVKVNYSDNPYFPDVLRVQMEHLKIKDHGMYRHVWLGECLEHSEAQVFKYGTHWIIDKFDDDPKAFKYQGMDFGYSGSPTFVLQMFTKDKKLFITYEAVKLGLDIDDTGAYCESQIPNFKKWAIYADNAILALISFLKKQGYKVEPVKKGAGSIEDGVGFMKSFKMIVVHERCVNMIQNMHKYSFVVDDRSGIISNTFEDANNDGIDAARYGLESLAKGVRADYSKIKVPDWMR